MLMNRDIFEQLIWWEPRGDTSSIWFDNWTRLGPLFSQPTEVQTCHNLTDINTYMNEGGWDYEKLQMQLPQHVVDHDKSSMDQIR
ncbi:hypothetical protein KY289_008147 [Solanum tuberosum]|nr:hypothetical protein KY289_008147 [Solanum tuberosum]